MSPVSKLIEELERNPQRFKSTDGYGRLLDLLRDGNDPDAVKQVLRGQAEFVGDLLWTVAELDNVEPFVSEAVPHILSTSKGTAAYAMEVVLRGSNDSSQLGMVLEQMCSCDAAVCRHAVRIMSSQGLVRVAELFEAGGWTWAAALLNHLDNELRPQILEDLIRSVSRDRQIVGLVLVTLASETDPSYVDYAKHSEHDWIREYAKWLEKIF